MAEFRRWFASEAEAFEILDATIGEIGLPPLLAVARSDDAARPGAGRARIVEQHAFATGGEQLESLSLLCSGFQPC